MSDDPILRQRRVALTQADTGLLLRRMMAEIPGLKVVDRATINWPTQMPEAADPYLRYWDGEGDPPDIDVMLWLEPEGWKTEWEYRRDREEVVLSNIPDTACCFEVCRMSEGHAGDLTPLLEEVRIAGGVDRKKLKGLFNAALKEQLTLVEGRLFGMQDEGDESHRIFLDKVFEILEEECSDRLIWWLHGDEPSLKLLKGFVWAGPEALRWGLEADNRYLTHGLRPLDSVPLELRARAVESYGLHITENQRFHDFLELNIPVRWSVQTLSNGASVACEEDCDTGTLWVTPDGWELHEPAREGSLCEHLASELYDSVSREEGNTSVERVEVGGYKAVYREFECWEYGEHLRFHKWTLFSAIREHLLLVNIDLVMSDEALSDPLCGDIVEQIQKAVANVRIHEEAFLEQVSPRH